MLPTDGMLVGGRPPRHARSARRDGAGVARVGAARPDRRGLRVRRAGQDQRRLAGARAAAAAVVRRPRRPCGGRPAARAPPGGARRQLVRAAVRHDDRRVAAVATIAAVGVRRWWSPSTSPRGALFRIGMFPWVMIVVDAHLLRTRLAAAARRPLAAHRLRHTTIAGARAGTTGAAVAHVTRRWRAGRGAGGAAPPAPGRPGRRARHRGGLLPVVAGDADREERGCSTSSSPTRSRATSGSVAPGVVLTDWQAAQAAVRPDLLLAAAHLVDEHERARVGHDVEVRADSFVSVNGRPARRLIDPTIDLSTGVADRAAASHRAVR